MEQVLYELKRTAVQSGHLDHNAVLVDKARNVCYHSVPLRHCYNHARALPGLPHVSDLAGLHDKRDCQANQRTQLCRIEAQLYD